MKDHSSTYYHLSLSSVRFPFYYWIKCRSILAQRNLKKQFTKIICNFSFASYPDHHIEIADFHKTNYSTPVQNDLAQESHSFDQM